MLNCLEQRQVLQTPGVSAGKTHVTFDFQPQNLTNAGESEGTVIASLSEYQVPLLSMRSPQCTGALCPA